VVEFFSWVVGAGHLVLFLRIQRSFQIAFACAFFSRQLTKPVPVSVPVAAICLADTKIK